MAWSAARNSVRREGFAGGEGLSHHLGRGALSTTDVRQRRHGRRAIGRGRRGARWQTRDGGARRRHGLQPGQCVVHGSRQDAVESRVLERRFVERTRRRRGGGTGAVRHRFGNIGLDTHAGGILRDHRIAADIRARESSRRHGARVDDGQARPTRPQRRGLCDRPRRDRGSRREGSVVCRQGFSGSERTQRQTAFSRCDS